MFMNTNNGIGKMRTLIELARDKILCDMIFGIRSADDYEKLFGSKFGRFIMVVVDIDKTEKKSNAAGDAIIVLMSLKCFQSASVIAISTCRIVVLEELGRAGGWHRGMIDEICMEMQCDLFQK
jgi:hypothetical protein